MGRYRWVCGLMIAIAIATQAAAAKDLRRDAPPPKATGCEWAGPGFAKVDGSDTCVRVGGSVRAEYGATVGRGGSGATSWGR